MIVHIDEQEKTLLHELLQDKVTNLQGQLPKQDRVYFHVYARKIDALIKLGRVLGFDVVR